jgi:phosphatidylglycerophosphate synthase
MIAAMKRNFTWAVFVGGVIVVLGVLLQSFTIAAYVRSGEEGALDAHGGGSLIVHIGQLAIVIGALVAYWGNWKQVGFAVGFLILAIAQLGFLGDTEEQGDWINGLHGFLALIILIAGLLYAQKAWRELRPTASPGAAGSA